MKSRPEIKFTAKRAFTNLYGLCIGANLVALLIICAASGVTYGIGSLLLVPPMSVGLCYFTLCVYRGQRPTINTMFQSGFYYYGHNLGGMLYMELFVFLWSLLFVIPGIVKAFAYSMTPYLLADHPRIPPTQALKISMRMTDGYKGELFVMVLSFLGWYLLDLLTFGLLGILYIDPYMLTSYAGMYEELKARALANGVIRPEELYPA